MLPLILWHRKEMEPEKAASVWNIKAAEAGMLYMGIPAIMAAKDPLRDMDAGRAAARRFTVCVRKFRFIVITED